MSNGLFTSMELKKHSVSRISGFCIGHIVQITADGKALIDFPDNQEGLIAARSVLYEPSSGDDNLYQGVSVLLLFENNDPTLPIIVGVVHDTLYPSTHHEQMILPSEHPHDVVVDGKKMVFEANEEILLRCGKSSIMLRKDGKIVVKGREIVSRASATNKIKGSSVMIN